MNYRLFIMSCFLALSFCAPTKLFAQCPTMNTGVNVPAEAAKIKNKMISSLTDTASQEEDKLRTAHNGNANCSSSPDKTPKIKSEAYEYVKKEILLAKESEILSSQKNYSEAIKKVEDTLFVLEEDDPSAQSFLSQLGAATGLKTTKMTKANKQRKKYSKEVSTKTAKVFADLPKKVREDAESIKQAQTMGCNQLHGHMYENRNLLALVKSTAAHIGAQVLNMESQAIKDIAKEPLRLIRLEDQPKSTSSK